MIRVIVTDDHKLVRDGIRALLGDDPAIEVVGDAADGNELIELLGTVPADIVLLDISMPVKDGYETTVYLREHFPGVKVLVVSMLEQVGYVSRIMALGASGYLLKSVGKEELAHAIHLVASGTNYICSEVTMELLQKVQPSAISLACHNADDDNLQHKELTKREVEVLALIGEGYTNAEIAEKLFTSKRTIETHRQNLLEKTQMRNTATLIKYALQKGIIS